MNKVHCCFSVLMLALMISVSGCGKSEPSSRETSQQQPLTQKLDELLKKAEAGDAEAQVALGDIFATGDGLPKDSARAADMFRKAAEKGMAKAQFRLGQMYANGEGVPKDGVMAVEFFKQAAANGYAKAQAKLGALYAKGEGVTHDDVLAYVWSSLALSQGDQEAKQVQDSVTLDSVLRDEAERLKAKWKRGVEIVREKQESVVPVGIPKKPSGQ